MKTKILAAVGAAGALVLAFEYGARFAVYQTAKDQEEKIALITRAFASVVERALEGGLDESQIAELLEEELAFMKIVKP